MNSVDIAIRNARLTLAVLLFLLIAGAPIQEPIAWHGPIVMNTTHELQQAFDDLRNDRFIRPADH